ncbi:MAG: beta-ketoacyl synthase N-terminal-like domain-containing protein, partial [Desulfobacterales bacterium]
MNQLSSDDNTASPIAVIGIGCFFPKAADLKQYWQLLYHGIDAIGDVPDTHWSPEDYFSSDPHAADRVYCKRGGFIPAVPFDPTAFGIPPANLTATDTSQILGLLAAKRALEDAGYGNGKPFDRDRTSVVLGVTGTQELVIPLGARLAYPQWRRGLEASGIAPDAAEKAAERIAEEFTGWQENSFPGLLGNVVAGRICNRLDLNGTNCVVDAACASSMSAINLAVMELQTRQSDMVITGGVDTLNDIFMHMCFARTQILSPTGDARPFSKNADGTVLGEGVGLVVLKRLEDAERDANRIYAVIKGIGASSDGKSQSIYAPRSEGQAKALRKAYQGARVDPSDVELVEAHGTGTRVGD